jgi:hypothetical protein
MEISVLALLATPALDPRRARLRAAILRSPARADNSERQSRSFPRWILSKARTFLISARPLLDSRPHWPENGGGVRACGQSLSSRAVGAVLDRWGAPSMGSGSLGNRSTVEAPDSRSNARTENEYGGCSSVGLERWIVIPEVGSSNLLTHPMDRRGAAACRGSSSSFPLRRFTRRDSLSEGESLGGDSPERPAPRASFQATARQESLRGAPDTIDP